MALLAQCIWARSLRRESRLRDTPGVEDIGLFLSADRASDSRISNRRPFLGIAFLFLLPDPVTPKRGELQEQHAGTSYPSKTESETRSSQLEREIAACRGDHVNPDREDALQPLH